MLALATASAVWAPAPLSAARTIQATIPRAETHMLLPKAVAAVAFVPWTFVIVINNLPTDLRLRIQKSNLLQSGTKMRTMKREPPKVRRLRLTQAALAVTSTFKKEYRAEELELLWAALVKCMGSKERALAAAQSNPQIINPSYTFCNTMLESKAALLEVMSEQEALEVMDNNPSVLQCGPSLAALGPAEIKTFASFRSLVSRVPEEVRALLLGAFAAVVLAPVVLAQNPHLADSELLSGAESVAGAVVAPVFFGIIVYLLKSSGG